MDEDPSYDIRVCQEAGAGRLSESQLVRVIEFALRRHDCRKASLDVALVGDAAIAELNQRYLGHTGPTDVLSFDLSPEGSADVDGQLTVSVETAAREAARRGHSLEAEVSLYCLHGVLHLLGHNDHDAEDARRMHACEDELLEELGVGAVYGRRAG